MTPEEDFEDEYKNLPEKLGIFPYVIAGLSFIPILGVFFGTFAIIEGTKLRPLIKFSKYQNPKTI